MLRPITETVLVRYVTAHSRNSSIQHGTLMGAWRHQTTHW